MDHHSARCESFVGLRETCLQLAKGVGICRRVGVPMSVAPWIVSDELWELVEPLLPVKERRFRYSGRKRLPDLQAQQGIFFVLHTGISWTHLPRARLRLRVTCWRA
jgi:putative transposase of IS4/5 family DUF4096